MPVSSTASVLDTPAEGRPDLDVASRAGRLRRFAPIGVAGLLLVALTVLAAVQVLSQRSRNNRNDDRTAAVAAARTEVSLLTGVTATGAPEQIKKLLDGATSSFKDNLSQFAATLQQALQQEKVTSTSTISESGVVSTSDGRVVVLVAVTASVKNASAPAGEPRNYRLKVSMQKSHGTWLVSDLAFVA